MEIDDQPNAIHMPDAFGDEWFLKTFVWSMLSQPSMDGIREIIRGSD